MDAAGPGGGRHSASPEDRSEGNETLSAPSEFLAEFLSAIMRRQYAEALKYCRLILQYEPHNATARSFYPLLRHKLHAPAPPPAPAPAPAPARTKHTEEETPAPEAGGDSSGDEGASPSRQEELMEHSASESEGEEDEGAGGADASCASGRSRSSAGDRSDLELDSSEALPSSPSVSLSRRTDRTDSASGASCCWESTGSASASRSEPARAPPASAPDDNGNAPLPLPAHTFSPPLLPDDLENDNAAAGGDGPADCPRGAGLQSDSVSSLRRLRAQFACSIK